MADEQHGAGSGEGLSLEGDAGIGEVQERFDEANSKGYIGTKVDPTPNENYSLEGGVDPKTGSTGPTPETDPELGREAREAALGDPFANFKASQDPQEVRAAAEEAADEAEEESDDGSADGLSDEEREEQERIEAERLERERAEREGSS